MGQWVTVQRKNWMNLDDDRRKRLSNLPNWATSARDALWEEGFRRLADYTEKHGGASPPQTYTDADGYKLGAWVAKERQSELKETLGADRRNRLLGLPGWEWVARESRWDECFRRLGTYLKENGDRYPLQTYATDDGYRLGAWLTQQRQKGLNGKLEAELADRLAKLPGWQWSPLDAAWQEAYQRLQAYAERNSNDIPPQTYIEDDGYRLGAWVSQQRQKFRNGTLSSERSERLSRLRGWDWSPPRGRRPPPLSEAWSREEVSLPAASSMEHGRAVRNPCPCALRIR